MKNRFLKIGTVAALLSLTVGAQAQQVYIGGGDNSPGAFDGYLADPAGWAYVRANAAGYYINNFALKPAPADAGQITKLTKMAGLFTHKNVFYETDLKRTTDIEDKTKIDILSQFFKVTYTTVNKGHTPERIAALKWRDAKRPVLEMVPPWLVSGDINSVKGAGLREGITSTDGMSTDGPLGLWRDNTGGMREGTYSSVKFTHAQRKTAMVMMATHEAGSGDAFLSIGQSCVRGSEDAGARPDIWVVSYYAAQIKRYPVTPEQVGGKPAGTVTGLGFWLLHHLQDPQHWARVAVPSADGVTLRSASRADCAVPMTTLKNGKCAAVRTVNFQVCNDSAWLDLCPTLRAVVDDPRHQWNVRFRIDGRDVTAPMASPAGLAFVRDLRLWPGQTKQIQMVLTGKNPSARPIDVHVGLMPSPSAVGPTRQTMTFHSALSHPPVLARL